MKHVPRSAAQRPKRVGSARLDASGRIVSADDPFDDLLRDLRGSEPANAADPLAGCDGPVAEAIRSSLEDGTPRVVARRARGPGPAPAMIVATITPRRRSGAGPFAMRLERVAVGPCPAARGASGGFQPVEGQVATAIHDLNNLLAAIAASAAVGREGVAPDTTLASALDVIEAAAGRGATLARRLLTLADSSSGAPRGVDVDAAVRALEPLLSRSSGRDVTLAVELGAPPDAWVDPVDLDRAILNLAANARAALAPEGQLTIRTGRSGAFVTVEVVDTGRGIAPALLPRVLRRGVSTGRASGGHGLGLASVLEAVHRADGLLRLESVVGRGTTVRLFLPPAIVSNLEGQTHGVGRLALVVEDEATLRALTAQLLTRDGWDVLAAGTAAAATKMAQTRLADLTLVVADRSLPDADGASLVRDLRARRPDLAAVITSGYLAAEVPGAATLAKPFTLEDFRRACARALGIS